jgi:hypothetical protein
MVVIRTMGVPLTGFGKHLAQPCPRSADRFYRRRSCPLWVIGTDPTGKYHRCTLRTSDWTTAEE